MKKTISLILIFFLVLLFYPVLRLQLIDVESGKVLKSFSIKNGQEFTIYFIHSVEKTPWFEIYYIENNEIYLKETIFFSYGAGLPSTTKHDFSFEEDGMHIRNYNVKMDPLIYRVGAVVADHTIKVNGEEIHFNELAKPFNSILIRVEEVPIYRYLIKGVAYIE